MLKLSKFRSIQIKKTGVLLFDKLEIGLSFLFVFLLSFFLEEVKLYFIYTTFLIFHELSHYFVAKRLGYLPAKLKITFFGASLEGYDDFYFDDEIKIVLAGPVFNFLIVIFCYLSFWFYPESFIILNDVLDVNLAILLFNCLPVFPLDFGRLILAISSIKNDRILAIKRVKTISFVFIVVLFCVFLLSFFYGYSFSFGLAVINLCGLNFMASNGTSYKRNLCAFSKLKNLKKGLREKTVYVGLKTDYFKLLKKIDNSSVTRFVFVDDEFTVMCEKNEFEILKELGL